MDYVMELVREGEAFWGSLVGFRRAICATFHEGLDTRGYGLHLRVQHFNDDNANRGLSGVTPGAVLRARVQDQGPWICGLGPSREY